jgi:ferric-dicitrate binding protein FerR (iron transport regulator)
MVGGGLVAMLLLRRSQPIQAMRVATTAPAERATFRLADGTRVILGVASVLRYPQTFPANSRGVQLEGEAYFEVAHEQRRPFIVRAGDLVATDLGTQFTVRAYPDDPAAQVVVREGRVAVRPMLPGKLDQVVAPGELGRLAKGGVLTVERADTAAAFAWTEGRLVFEDTPLREALPQLGRWFDLEFRLADSAMGDIPLTATLRTQPTVEVLDNLAASLGMRRKQLGRTVTLYAADAAP